MKLATHIILIDVSSSLHQAGANHELFPTPGSLLDIAFCTRNLSCDSGLDGLGEVTDTTSADHGDRGASSLPM